MMMGILQVGTALNSIVLIFKEYNFIFIFNTYCFFINSCNYFLTIEKLNSIDKPNILTMESRVA